jgi:hypothetical protein
VDLKLPAQKVHIVNAVGETGEIETQPAPGDSSTRLLNVPLKAGSPVYVIAAP